MKFYHKWPLWLALVIVGISYAPAQTYDQIIKLRAEYEKLKEAKDEQMVSGQSLVGSESDGPTRVLYKPEDLDEFYRIQLSQLVQSIEEIETLKSFFDSTAGFIHYGYDIFNRTDSISYFENMPLPENYNLGTGDEIIISLWGEVEREEKSVINRDGNVFLEDVGLVHLGGKSLDEAKNAISKKFEQTYATLKGPNPKTFINVSLGNLKGVNVNILGFVKNPGVYALHPFSTPYSAIFNAGGIDTTGSLRRIELYRNGSKIETIDFYNMIHQGSGQQSIKLLDQDIIFVPPRNNKVLVNGEILKPGYFELLASETIADIIAYSGGLNPKASSVSHVKRIHPPENRNNDDEAIEYLSVPYSAFNHFIIMNGDSIGIPEINTFSPTVSLNGWVKRPGVYPFIKGQSLNKLLEMGGGFSDPNWLQSIAKEIVINRLDSDGKREVQKLSLNDILNMNNEFMIEPFDEVIVFKNDHYPFNESVHVSGEVNAEGHYAIEGQSIDQLIKVAGGLTPLGFKEGIALVRDTLKIGLQTLHITPLAGDSIIVPTKPGTIEVLGAVNHPGFISFEYGQSINDFIEKAGGFTIYANKKDIFVIYPNGIAKRKTRFSTPNVTEGSTIMVSSSQLVVQQVDYLEVSQQIASIIGSLATVALIINTQK